MFRKSAVLLQSRKLKLDFVPQCTSPAMSDVEKLEEFVQNSRSLFVLTGAGLSTESGIPDYRSEGVGLYARSNQRPMSYQDFVKTAKNRQRYWARNYVGWPQFASFQPNDSHTTLAEWQDNGKISVLVTQNVDALHTKAGAKDVVELHGSTHRVVCLSCKSITDRWELQKLFRKLNPHFQEESAEIAPDGDVMLTEKQVSTFSIPPCPSCGGILKPDVVFFGDNVARSKVDHVFTKVSESDAMLVAGSSLQVFSAYRFVKRARDQNKPIAVINIGKTRADDFVNVKVAARCTHVLPVIKIYNQT